MRTLLLALCLSHLAAADAARDARWQADLDTLATQLPQLHPNLFFKVSRADFNQAVADLRAAIPQLSDAAVMVGLARITALPGDAHTNLFLTQRNSAFRLLPLQLKWFADGLFVTAAGQSYPQAVGARVLQIGARSLDDTYQAVASIISHENDTWVRDQSPNYLVNADILQALGIAPSNTSVTFVLQDAAGAQFTLDIASLAPGGSAALILAPDPAAGFTPFYLQQTNRNYWFTYIASSRTLYFAYNVCANMASLSFADFNTTLWQTFDSNQVDRFIIDLRNNSGGDSSVLNPFLQSGTARAAQLTATRAAVIIGNHTFSSAVLNAITMKQGPVMLIGEPTGGSANAYGEVKTLVLPNSQLAVSYSTRYIFTGFPDGPVVPDVIVPVYSADWFARHDPYLAAVLADETPLPAIPVSTEAAVVNAANSRLNSPIAPGSLATVYTAAALPSADAPAIPLPTKLAGVEVLVNGVSAPLYVVRPGQINFQVPSATPVGPAAVEIRRDGARLASATALVASAAPGIFATDASAPLSPGAVVQIYATGQGATDPAAPDGGVPSQLTQSRLAPRVYFGAELAEVLFSGLQPSLPGVWQINVRVPATGNLSGQTPVFVAIGSNAGNAVTVPLGN